jgi:hypothetical protein
MSRNINEKLKRSDSLCDSPYTVGASKFVIETANDLPTARRPAKLAGLVVRATTP